MQERAAKGKARQGRGGQGRAGQGRAETVEWSPHQLVAVRVVHAEAFSLAIWQPEGKISV